MKTRRKVSFAVAGLGILLGLSSLVSAQTWNRNANGNWSTASNWTPATVPNAVGANATLGNIITSARTVMVNSNATIGSLTINATNNYTVSTSAFGESSTLTMDATGAGPATINIMGSGSPRITGSRLSLALADNTLISHTGTGLFTIGSVISGAGSLTHNGTGTTLLSGVNTYTGGLTVNSGTVRFGNNSAAGTGTLTLNGGTIEASGAARSLNAPVTVGGDFAVGGSKAMTLSGNMSLGASTRTVTVNNSAATTFGAVSGAGGLTKNGTGSLTLGGGSSYTGNTTVNGGTLRAGAAGTAFGNNSAVTLANVSNAKLDLAGFNTAIGSLAGGGATGGNVTLGAGNLITGGDNSSTSYAGTISGTGSLTKTGAGQLSFTGTGANSYTGATTVNGGTLELAKSNNVTSIAGSVITVNSGGTLLLSASEQINNAANLTMNSGTLATSDINGIETLGTLTLTGNSVIDLGNAAYLLKFANSSAISWSGTLTIYGWMTTPATSGTQNQIYFGNNASGLTNAQLAMVSFNGFGPGAMLLTSGELVPVGVPEAGPVVAAALIGLVVVWRERRRLTDLIRPQATA